MCTIQSIFFSGWIREIVHELSTIPHDVEDAIMHHVDYCFLRIIFNPQDGFQKTPKTPKSPRSKRTALASANKSRSHLSRMVITSEANVDITTTQFKDTPTIPEDSGYSPFDIDPEDDSKDQYELEKNASITVPRFYEAVKDGRCEYVELWLMTGNSVEHYCIYFFVAFSSLMLRC